jgi:hypothetical protein
VDTSAGPMAVELDFMTGWGLEVEVTVFRADGWEVRPQAEWRQGLNKETLSEFLIDVARLPEPEAEQVAADIEGPWQEHWMSSGGKEYVRSSRRFMRVAMPVFGLILLLALVAVGLLAWLVVAALS